MVYLPMECKVIENSIGLAPGIVIEHGGVKIIALSRVPEEMKAMFNEKVSKTIRPKRISEIKIHR